MWQFLDTENWQASREVKKSTIWEIGWVLEVLFKSKLMIVLLLWGESLCNSSFCFDNRMRQLIISGLGDTRPIYSVPLFSQFFRIIKQWLPTQYHIHICSVALLPPFKYECDLKDLRCTFAKSDSNPHPKNGLIDMQWTSKTSTMITLPSTRLTFLHQSLRVASNQAWKRQVFAEDLLF